MEEVLKEEKNKSHKEFSRLVEEDLKSTNYSLYMSDYLEEEETHFQDEEESETHDSLLCLRY